MNHQHKQLAAGHWQDFTLIEQLANVGSEIGRCINWQTNGYGNPRDAFYRALELIDLTLADPKNKHRLREVCRTREALVDWFAGNNTYNTTNAQWEAYFYQFTYAARLNK